MLYICMSDSSNCYKHKDHLMPVLFSPPTLWFLSDFWNIFLLLIVQGWQVKISSVNRFYRYPSSSVYGVLILVVLNDPYYAG